MKRTKTVLDDLIKNLKRIKPETIYARSVDKEALDEAAITNVSQLEAGLLDDEDTTGIYKKATQDRNDIRKTKISAGDLVKFKDTGKFHKSIRAKISRDGDLTLYSRSKKAQLAQDYVDFQGKDGKVLGLTEENLEKWYEVFVHDQFRKLLIERIMYYQ